MTGPKKGTREYVLSFCVIESAGAEEGDELTPKAGYVLLYGGEHVTALYPKQRMVFCGVDGNDDGAYKENVVWSKFQVFKEVE